MSAAVHGPLPSAERARRRLVAAVRYTLAYAELFECPLDERELQRYLHGQRATREELRALLREGLRGVAAHQGLYVHAGRLALVAERHRRAAAAGPLIARARRYALLIRHLPYVRMIGLSGSLAMGNAAEGCDIDLMIVAAPGRVWLCRALVVALVRLARLRGDRLCPNYVVAADALALSHSSIYDAHELAQLLPLYGQVAYGRLWAANAWVHELLPNAAPHAAPPDRLLPGAAALKHGLERLLAGRLGDRLEAWERRRKTARLRRATTAWEPGASGEIVLSAAQCKGHFGGHRARVLARYAARLQGLRLDPVDGCWEVP